MILYDMGKLRTIAWLIKHRRQTVQGQKLQAKQSVQDVFVRSNQQKAALEQQKAAMEHDLEVESHPVFWFPYAMPIVGKTAGHGCRWLGSWSVNFVAAWWTRCSRKIFRCHFPPISC